MEDSEIDLLSEEVSKEAQEPQRDPGEEGEVEVVASVVVLVEEDSKEKKDYHPKKL